MTATINASNSGSGGLISTGDASGSLALQTAGTTAVTIDTSQNVGIGVTPSAWTSIDKQIEIGRIGNSIYGGGLNEIALTANTYYSSGWKYAANGYANRFDVGNGNGTFAWFNAASGTAGGTPSFTQAMTLDSSGNLLVGWTGGTYNDPGYNNKYGFSLVSPSTSCYITVCSDNPHYFYRVGTGNVQRFEYKATLATSGTNVGSISITASATAYNTSSDYRLKNTITPMTGALATVALLKPCTYKWNVNGSDGQGFIAHELAEVVPDCVTGEKDAIDADGKPQYQGIDVSFLVATLTAAIQELKAINDTQAETINALTARVVALESK